MIASGGPVTIDSSVRAYILGPIGALMVLLLAVWLFLGGRLVARNSLDLLTKQYEARIEAAQQEIARLTEALREANETSRQMINASQALLDSASRAAREARRERL